MSSVKSRSNFCEIYVSNTKCLLTSHRNIQYNQYLLIIAFYKIQIHVFVYYSLCTTKLFDSTTRVLFVRRDWWNVAVQYSHWLIFFIWHSNDGYIYKRMLISVRYFASCQAAIFKTRSCRSAPFSTLAIPVQI